MILNDQQSHNTVEDKMHDSFLSQLLSYKTQLVDQEFVDNLMFRVKRFERIRYLIIATCALLGVFSLSRVTSLEHLNLTDIAQFSLFTQLNETIIKLPVESLSAIILGSMMTLVFWLFVTD